MEPSTRLTDDATARRPRDRAVAPLWLADLAAWSIGLVVAVWTRYEFAIAGIHLNGLVLAILAAVVLHTAASHLSYLYRDRYPLGSFDEVWAVSRCVLATIGVLLLADLAAPQRPVPASAPLVGGCLALTQMLGVRYLRRLRHERRRRPVGRHTQRVLLFGAGAAGASLLRAMLDEPGGRYLPVGLLDDDPAKRQLWLHGVPVLGGRHDIPAVAARTGATTVVSAVANADAALIREIRQLAHRAGARFKVVPSVSELLENAPAVTDLRDPDLRDLLGRHQIETDLDTIAGYLTGKRVLVTGAGGSIGSELCRQIMRFQPGELMMLDRDESALHAVQLSLRGRALLDSPDLILADLRDSDTVRQIMRSRRPEVVFHAAALKHLTLLERHPGEAVKTNVWGTQTLLEACRSVERFVNISTDKAADPTSVLGYSKRITERLTAFAAGANEGTFLSVRFGNVLGSRGSVLHAFMAQAAAGKPITVTDPEVTRYFMTIQEAVQLVIQAAAIGRGGEALVLDMGEPVRIADVARTIAEQYDNPVKIIYTGLRPGEKLHEDLLGAGEQDTRPLHPLISQVAVPALDPVHVHLLDPYGRSDDLVDDLAALCAPAPVPTGAGRSVHRAGTGAGPAGGPAIDADPGASVSTNSGVGAAG
ncbi:MULTISPECIES: nucleoside-diphosphate sugar epimerase/dehydratase [unclassified Solwaraspora]|uniref:nucleoside-diphosphate sugar epimerase/dehydratase n=1 Tax=unclassified Solwaraspora TaxID=2627926 RepID=UPI00259BAC82|nr:nucleoside-diphosphate sugar epimerase/dehydratase [Solwaraspora sp. WMMA2056]WJK38860.1 nucleoside-diphosphate sugar epimerase/dehydratase [Solwaraspora sp. WMMA2056]